MLRSATRGRCKLVIRLPGRASDGAGSNVCASIGGVDPEERARAIIAEASRDRKRPSRGLWIASLAALAICAAALAIAWWQDRDTVAEKKLPRAVSSSQSDLWLGIAVGIAVGFAIGILFARRRRSD
jgi:hypothetical protein